ncbi:MAG: transcription elongation factor GreB [Osedax symbiont Rs1]|nr:MAG: transcription elongation factor GreB [Osedax symbiont Rs1]
MGRWRAPQAPSSKYITQAGYNKLNAELRYLWKDKRPKITLAVQEAAAQGDRSDNAEYTEGKRLLREIDRRVRFLAKRLEDINVINHIPENQTIIVFGAWVTLLDDQEQQRTFRIIGPDEIDTSGTLISMDSPLAKALFKKQVGDEVEFSRPDGTMSYFEILAIEYRKE